MLPVSLRSATASDDLFLGQLYQDNHRHEFAPLDLPEPQLVALLTMQAEAQRSGYARDFPQALNQVVISQEENPDAPIGRLLVERRPDCLQLVDIALLPAVQGFGIGTALIQRLIEQAEREGLPLRLHVRVGNPAARLYSRLGFKIIGAGLDLVMEYGSWFKRVAGVEAEEIDEKAPAAIWRREIGSLFTVGADLPRHLTLTLIDVQQGRAPGTFTLLFEGPLEVLLQQATYALERGAAHADTEATTGRPVFLVPIGPTPSAMQYEAVFNSI